MSAGNEHTRLVVNVGARDTVEGPLNSEGRAQRQRYGEEGQLGPSPARGTEEPPCQLLPNLTSSEEPGGAAPPAVRGQGKRLSPSALGQTRLPLAIRGSPFREDPGKKAEGTVLYSSPLKSAPL